MPEENSIFMKTSSRALGILTQLHSETAQAMYAYTVGRQQGANEMALSNAILAERLIGCYRVIPSLLALPRMAGFPSGFPDCFPERSVAKAPSNTSGAFWGLPCSAFSMRDLPSALTTV